MDSSLLHELARGDHGAAPDLRNQLVLDDHLSGPLDQHHQDVQRAAAQRDRAAVLYQASAPRDGLRSFRRIVRAGPCAPGEEDTAT